MTKLLHNKARWLIAFACIVPAYGQTDQHIVRLNMKEYAVELPETLSVYVEIAAVQPDVEQGIVFTLNIENNGSQTIQMLDPIDMFRVSLTSFKLGGAVNLKRTRPDYMTCKIYSFSDEQLKDMHDKKMARRPFLAFDSEDALRNRHMKTVSDIVPHMLDRNRKRNDVPKSKKEQFQAIPAGKLTLEASEHFQAVIQIARIVSNPVAPERNKAGKIVAYASRRQDNPHIVDIMPDTYSLRVSLLLITDLEEKHGWTTSSDRITIQLGEPDSQAK